MEIEDFKRLIFEEIEAKQKRIENQRKLISKFEEEGKIFKIEQVEQNIRNALSKIVRFQGQYDYARSGNDKDMMERLEIKNSYLKIINEVIPDKTPIVFHGTDNLGVILEIIKTGGLLTPEQRGADMTSFANQIDVTYKSNIRVSCEFADSNNENLPYGAIFAFEPLENEREEVINTGDSSEVYGGVNGVNFREEPERLVGIITTRGKCRENSTMV